MSASREIRLGLKKKKNECISFSLVGFCPLALWQDSDRGSLAYVKAMREVDAQYNGCNLYRATRV